MACGTTKDGQTLAQRAADVKAAIQRIADALAKGRAKVTIGPQGAVAFVGLTADERDGVTDACAYQRIMSTGSALARAAIARAEQMSGRAVDRKTVAAGTHSHDGGKTWHGGH